MKTLVLLLAPLMLLAQSPGSLFSPSGPLANPARDLRASGTGDIVTIVVSDTASAIAKGVTNTSRKSSASAQIPALVGTPSSAGALANLLNTTGSQQLQGQGETSRNMTLSTTISARVVATTLNGLLVVEGTKNIGVNSEKQTVVLKGLVRPEDLTPGNTIPSDRVADLTVQVNGKGVVGDSIKRPFVLYRLLLGMLPF